MDRDDWFYDEGLNFCFKISVPLTVEKYPAFAFSDLESADAYAIAV